jgi:hypothetical protein
MRERLAAREKTVACANFSTRPHPRAMTSRSDSAQIFWGNRRQHRMASDLPLPIVEGGKWGGSLKANPKG